MNFRPSLMALELRENPTAVIPPLYVDPISGLPLPQNQQGLYFSYPFPPSYAIPYRDPNFVGPPPPFQWEDPTFVGPPTPWWTLPEFNGGVPLFLPYID